MLTFFRNASETFYGTATSPGLFAAQQQLADGGSPTSDFGPSPSQNPLLTKQAIIVLREELEYFSIPPKNGGAATNTNGIANDALLDLKRKCGDYLLHKRNIFTALQRNVNKENNVAEQHLIDMLCMRCVLTIIPVVATLKLSQRVRPRRRMGVPRNGTIALLYLFHSSRASQDRDSSPPPWSDR